MKNLVLLLVLCCGFAFEARCDVDLSKAIAEALGLPTEKEAPPKKAPGPSKPFLRKDPSLAKSAQSRFERPSPKAEKEEGPEFAWVSNYLPRMLPPRDEKDSVPVLYPVPHVGELTLAEMLQDFYAKAPDPSLHLPAWNTEHRALVKGPGAFWEGANSTEKFTGISNDALYETTMARFGRPVLTGL